MSTYLSKSFLCLFFLFVTSSGCGCGPMTVEDSFCQAEWVSRVRVLSQQPSMNPLQTSFAVQHVQIFKQPVNMITLPLVVSTPIDSAACGLPIMVGRDYLLAGSIQNNALAAFSCGQIKPEIPGNPIIGLLPEWQQLPIGLVETLQAIQCQIG